MSENSLKQKATKGIFWNAVENFSIQAFSLLLNIILARVLFPSDYGMLSMLAIFIALSQSLINAGMGTALIQKKDRSSIDFSTVFIFNLFISVLIYGVIFFCAPLISIFYKMPELKILTRVLTISIIIDAFSLIQVSRLSINMDFRMLAKVNIISVVISGVIAIAFAYNNYGVWALVIQNLVRSIIAASLLWYFSSWMPKMVFSKRSFKTLFSFGSRLMGAGIIATLFNNLYKVVIGKVYTARVLGFYAQGLQFADLTAGSITNILQKVTFPILSNLNNDRQRMVAAYKKLLGMTAFIIFPAMTLLALLADPFIRIFLGEKWLLTIPLLQWLAFARIIYPISALNMNILNASGRSDLFFKVDISKLPMTIIALIITIPLGIEAVVIGHVVTSSIAFFINAYMPGKLFGYGATQQLKDMFPKIICTLVMAFLVFAIMFFIPNLWLKFFTGLLVGVISYYSISFFFKIEEVNEINKFLKLLLPSKVKHKD